MRHNPVVLLHVSPHVLCVFVLLLSVEDMFVEIANSKEGKLNKIIQYPELKGMRTFFFRKKSEYMSRFYYYISSWGKNLRGHCVLNRWFKQHGYSNVGSCPAIQSKAGGSGGSLQRKKHKQ